MASSARIIMSRHVIFYEYSVPYLKAQNSIVSNVSNFSSSSIFVPSIPIMPLSSHSTNSLSSVSPLITHGDNVVPTCSSNSSMSTSHISTSAPIVSNIVPGSLAHNQNTHTIVTRSKTGIVKKKVCVAEIREIEPTRC